MAAVQIKAIIGDLAAPSFVYENDAIMQQDVFQAAGLVGEELSVDNITLTIKANYEETHEIEILKPNDGEYIHLRDGSILATANTSKKPHISDVTKVAYGTPLYYYENEELIGKFYVSSVERIGKVHYKIYAISAIGLLDKMYCGGGLINTTFSEALAMILSEKVNGSPGDRPVIQYTIIPEVATQRVYGWMPHDTKRKCLYQLMFANGVNIIRGDDGNPIFTFTYPTGARAIDSSKIYDSGSVTYNKSASEINVVEHAYSVVGNEQEVTVFDNSTGETANEQQIWFTTAPVQVESVKTTGDITVRDITVNGAIVSGNGSIQAKPYTHSTQTVTQKNELSVVDTDYVISVTDATMVNYLNSANILARLYAYYCGADGNGTQTIKTSIIVREGDDKDADIICGQNYTFLNPFEEETEAYVKNISLRTTTFGKATCEMVANYNPAGSEGLYQNSLILDKETFKKDGGVFDVQKMCPGATHLLVILIGGGQGGQSGYPGENGRDATVYTNVDNDFEVSEYAYGAEGGAGGKGGSGGNPGRVLYVPITSPAAYYSYTIGDGGEGGAETGFIPDTVSELRAALMAENPGATYTSDEIREMVAEQTAKTDWKGSPNNGAEGTHTTFGIYTSEDGSIQPYVYHPILKKTFAKIGESGIPGGNGGAIRATGTDGELSWIRSGESVIYKGKEYKGGSIGNPVSECAGLPEAVFTAFGGNGAGAAVGVSSNQYSGMHGAAAPEAYWTVEEDT